MANKTMTFHESYGTVTTSLLRTIKKYNVPPASFWELEDVYEEEGRTVDLDQIERFIKLHAGSSGNYIGPWPLQPWQLFQA